MTKFKVGDRVMDYGSTQPCKATIQVLRDDGIVAILPDGELLYTKHRHPKCLRKLKKKVKLSGYYVTVRNGSVLSVCDKPEPAEGFYNQSPYSTMPIEEFLRAYRKQ